MSSTNATILNNTLVNTLNANLDTTPHNTLDNTLDNTLNANLDNTPDNTSHDHKPFSKLPLKFQKYLAFAFWLSNHFKDNGFLNNDIPFHLILSSFNSFDTTSSQINFFNHFDNILLLPSLFNLSSYGSREPTVPLDEPSLPSGKPKKTRKSAKSKEPTDTVVDTNAELIVKEDKPKKSRKSAKKTNDDNVDATLADPATEEKPKKQRKSAKSKKPVVDPVVDPVTDLVSKENKPKKQRKTAKNATTNANNDTTATVEPVAVVSGSNEEQPKKTKKTKKSKEAVLPPTNNTEETKVEEDKPVKNTKKTKSAVEKPKKTKQTKQDEIVVIEQPIQVTVEENIDDEEEDEEDIDVTKIQIEGKEYLIDTNKNIYDIDSHDVIGSYINNVLEVN